MNAKLINEAKLALKQLQQGLDEKGLNTPQMEQEFARFFGISGSNKASIAKANKSISEIVALSFMEAERMADTINEKQSQNAERQTGDLTVRLHNVYQDMSDPYLKFIASNPTNWVPIGNRATVKASGDTEFILVFDDRLDARFKSISADPTEVVQARLRSLRTVLNMAIASGGIITKAYGIPLPDSMESSGRAGTIDYSKMTGEEALITLQNQSRKNAIAALKTYAIDQVGGISMNNASVLLEQLYRRTAWFDSDATTK